MNKSFFRSHSGNPLIKKTKEIYMQSILGEWNDEVPEHVEKFNSFDEDRTAVIYFGLFVEIHINKVVETFFPRFEEYFGLSKSNITTRINILRSLDLFPEHIFESINCIRDIRNEFAHEIKIINLDDFKSLPQKRQKKTIEKLIKLTKEYRGDYNYENIEDTLRNRFKSLSMNTISAIRFFEPIVKELRERIEKE